MQRSFSYKNALNQFALVCIYAVYVSLSSLYPLLPPLLAILFFSYNNALKRHDLFSVIIIVLMLLIFEAEKGFWFGSTVIFFTLLSRLVIPKIDQMLQCQGCMAAFIVALAYPGYWIFIWLTNQVLLLALPMIDWHIILYIIIEFLILMALL
ncbi:MAG: hypothetical protein PHO27_00450 [Sulfuricurvum sp.]|nr:hypothetical protein [Sulfuricurvum sp.]